MGARRRACSKISEASDYAILNRDDPNVWKLAKSVRSHVIGFGLSAR